MSGHRYLIGIADPAIISARGLDAAERIRQRLRQVVVDALAADPEVLEVESAPIFSAATPDCARLRGCIANLHDDDCPER